MEAGPIQPMSPKIQQPKFVPRPDTGSAKYDFHTKIEWLPSKLNIRRDASLSWVHQSCLINLTYDSQQIFSLHEKVLGYCDHLKYTMLTMTDKSVYLLHHTIPRMVHEEECKCLGT